MRKDYFFYFHQMNEKKVETSQLNQEIEKTIEKLRHLFTHVASFDDVLSTSSFMERFIQLFYFRNILGPYLVFLSDMEVKQLIVDGNSVSIDENQFYKIIDERETFKVDHWNEHCQIYIKKRMRFQRSGVLDPHYIVSHCLNRQKSTQDFNQYLNDVQTRPLASIKELGQLLDHTYMKTHLHHQDFIQLYDLDYISENKTDFDTNVSAYLKEKQFDLFEKEPKRISNEQYKCYLMFVPLADLSMEATYAYFQQVTKYLHHILYLKCQQYLVRQQILQNANYHFDLSVERFALRFGTNLRLSYRLNQWQQTQNHLYDFDEELTAYTLGLLRKEKKKLLKENVSLNLDMNYQNENTILEFGDVENPFIKKLVKNLLVSQVFRSDADVISRLKQLSNIKGAFYNSKPLSIKLQDKNFLKYLSLSQNNAYTKEYQSFLEDCLDLYVQLIIASFHIELQYAFAHHQTGIAVSKIIKAQLTRLSYLFYGKELLFGNSQNDLLLLNEDAYKDWVENVTSQSNFETWYLLILKKTKAINSHYYFKAKKVIQERQHLLIFKKNALKSKSGKPDTFSAMLNHAFKNEQVLAQYFNELENKIINEKENGHESWKAKY